MSDDTNEIHSLEDMLGDFDPNAGAPVPLRTGSPVTIWLLPEDKARYNRIQKMSGQRFSKKVRETLLALIALAEKRAS